MDIKQLEYFLSLDKYKLFTETAEELNMSQSSLSKHIKSIEEEMGTALFQRTNSGVELTEAGQIFKKFAVDVLDKTAVLDEEIKEQKKHSQNIVKIGSMPIISEYGISDLLFEFSKNHKDCKLELVESSLASVYEKLERKEVIFGFIGGNYVNRDKYNEILLYKDKMVFAVSENHKLSNRDSVRISELKDESFILLDDQSGLNSLINNLCDAEGFRPKIISYHSNVNSILSLASKGMGAALLLERTVADSQIQGLRFIDVEDKVEANLVLAYPKKIKLSKVEKEFVNAVKDKFNVK